MSGTAPCNPHNNLVVRPELIAKPLLININKFIKKKDNKEDFMKNNKKISNKLYNVISDTAFIVLPFNEKWSDDVTSGIKEVCEGLGIKANRADDLYNTKNTFIDDILKSICQSQLIIVDISKHNPNVFYELGIAQGYNKDIILLHQKDGDPVPSDITSIRHLSYGMYPSSFDKFKKELRDIIIKVKSLD